ncbi:MAG TPA: RNA-binding protein [Sandaracinaceae bacterium LLY-WYZ-13_1]|nr:RNA-binding protein [Sandaracinaceae bacterium LLY-WYZ-13_1]
MSTPGKRAREDKKARKKREKEERRWEKRQEGPSEVPVVTPDELMVAPTQNLSEIMEDMDGGATVAGGGPSIPSKLFVGSLSYDTDSDSLRKAFEAYGEVLEAVVIHDRDTGRSRGFGFVTMASHKDAPRAIKGLDGTDLDGRRIVVNVATDKR